MTPILKKQKHGMKKNNRMTMILQNKQINSSTAQVPAICSNSTGNPIHLQLAQYGSS